MSQVNAIMWLMCPLLSAWVWDSSGLLWLTAKWPPTSMSQVIPLRSTCKPLDGFHTEVLRILLQRCWCSGSCTHRQTSCVTELLLVICAQEGRWLMQRRALTVRLDLQSFFFFFKKTSWPQDIPVRQCLWNTVMVSFSLFNKNDSGACRSTCSSV